MRFPSTSLIPKGGEIYCHIFENEAVELARNLFWSITVEFHPVRYGGEQFDCSLACEWIPWPIRTWQELEGRRLDVGYGDEGVEASFYMCEHHVADRIKLDVNRRSGTQFRVSVEALIDFAGYYGDDQDPAMPVRAEADLPFTGLLVIPDNLSPPPSTPSELSAVACEFVDLSVYGEPESRKPVGSVFRPIG